MEDRPSFLAAAALAGCATVNSSTDPVVGNWGLKLGYDSMNAGHLAIEQIVGHHYELDDFQIQAVTGGKESIGSAFVKLRSNGKLYSGNGISTDIVGASIRAYINALNKIIYEEN